MALFYRGEGIGSYRHPTDARLTGFSRHAAGATPSIDRIISHVARSSKSSPFVSLSRSFGIARAYGLVGPGGFASAKNRGYVYEIEISDDSMCKPLDPIVEIARHIKQPWDAHYQHG
jgi:hypothetical protein